MQVARNFFLSREKTYIRKLIEILLALKIEREITKDEILELYVNKIFLGQRAYGVGAARAGVLRASHRGAHARPARDDRRSAEGAVPVQPDHRSGAAVVRRNYVLRRMLDLGYIEKAEHDEARDAPVTARIHGLAIEAEAPYVAEMVRAHMEATYGDDTYIAGFKVHTTLDSRLQYAAVRCQRGAEAGADRL